MAWVRIPNVVVKGFTGLPIKTMKMDNDFEPVFKPITCPGCKGAAAYKTTSYADFRAHASAEGLDLAALEIPVETEMVEADTASLLLTLVARLNNQSKENPMAVVRKGNDAMHAAEVWRRVNLAVERKGDILLKPAQKDWVESLLGRKVPITKEQKSEGLEEQTVAMLLWSLSEYNVRQAMKPLSERVAPEADEEEQGSNTNGVGAVGEPPLGDRLLVGR